VHRVIVIRCGRRRPGCAPHRAQLSSGEEYPCSSDRLWAARIRTRGACCQPLDRIERPRSEAAYRFEWKHYEPLDSHLTCGSQSALLKSCMFIVDPAAKGAYRFT
jgi:hypothetical protein